ncbi:zinc ribbon domain-containing protein [Streptomyces sp. NPDC050523]|uniref:zinc ribbon domain-containing protein n=1 Tax=Streptomyces sp. NPDC050523 TaxID=3365622 RepID=UPI0037940186
MHLPPASSRPRPASTPAPQALKRSARSPRTHQVRTPGRPAAAGAAATRSAADVPSALRAGRTCLRSGRAQDRLCPREPTADAAIGATKKALVETARKHGRAVHLAHPTHTTMDCATCGARTKHALPLPERTYTCTACGTVSPRDKNSARVMLVRAGLQPGWC